MYILCLVIQKLLYFGNYEDAFSMKYCIFMFWKLKIFLCNLNCYGNSLQNFIIMDYKRNFIECFVVMIKVAKHYYIL